MTRNIINDLEKGSLQSKNPFKPYSQEVKDNTIQQRYWTMNENSDMRNALPTMEGASKIRSLNKLSAKTDVRRHPTTGERLFLMHRGMNDMEFNENHENGKTNYQTNSRNGWTPKYDVAQSFSGPKGHVVSAWVPESNIIHDINQHNVPPKHDARLRNITEREENEFIIEHKNQMLHANLDAIAQKKAFNEKINKKIDQHSLFHHLKTTNDLTLFKHPLLNSHHLEHAMLNNDPNMRANAAGHALRSGKVISKAMKDFDPMVRMSVFNPQLPLDQKTIELGKKDISVAVKDLANNHPSNQIHEKLAASECEINDLEKGSADEDALGALKAQPEHQEVLDWARKTIPSNTARTWYLHHYSQNPSIHKDMKPEMEHHGSMMGKNKHINEIKFNKKLPLTDGINQLQEADQKWQQESIEKGGLVKPSKETTKMLDLGNGWGWYNLKTGHCDDESNAMGHCGGTNPNTQLLSLRKEIKKDGKVYHQPHVTVEYTPEIKAITQIKGKQNTKPDSKYHPAIMSLLESDHVKYKAPSAYRPETDFQLSDLNKDHHNRIMEKKPDLDFMSIKDPDRFDKIREDLGDSVDNDFMANWSRFLRGHGGDLNSALESGDDDMKMSLLEKHPELTRKHFEDATYSPNQFLQKAALKNPNFPTDLIDHHINNNHYLEPIAKHPNTTKDQLMKIIMENKMSGDGAVRALTRPEITGDDYTYILRNSKNLSNNMDRLPKAMFNMIKSPEYDKFRPEHVQLGWDYIQPDVVGHAIDLMKEHPETIKQEYFDEALGDKKKHFDYDTKRQLLELLAKNPKYVKPDHIHHGFSHTAEVVNNRTKDVLVKNPDIIKEEYLSHMTPGERMLFDREVMHFNPNLKDWTGRTTDPETLEEK